MLLSNVINFCLNELKIALKKKKYGWIIERNVKINGRIYLHGDGFLKVGSHVRINSSEAANPIGGMRYSVFVVENPGVLSIGDNVGISNSAIVCRNKITIEEGVKIGGSVKIYDTDFHAIDSDKRNSDKDRYCAKSSPIRIKKNAFIGAHSIILKGVTVGENSVIGAGSVVTRSIGDGEIWAGNPAVFIRSIEDSVNEKDSYRI